MPEERIRICFEIPASAFAVEPPPPTVQDKPRTKYDLNREIMRNLGIANRNNRCMSLEELRDRLNLRDDEIEAFKDAFRYLTNQGAIREERRNCYRPVDRRQNQ